MSRNQDYIPARDADFHAWFENLVKFVRSKVEAEGVWDYIPMTQSDALFNAFEDWERHYLPTLEPHTPAVTAGKNEARKRAERVIREFVQRFLHWDPVTVEDRVNMGIPERDTTRTDHTVVHEVVDYVIHLSHIRELKVEFRVAGSGSKAKPAGYDGAVVKWDVLEKPPLRPDDLSRHEMASRTPHSLFFDETERGKTAYICLCWQNERGIKGQWSEIKWAIIP